MPVTDVQIIAEALWSIHNPEQHKLTFAPKEPCWKEADAVVVALGLAGRVIVDRDDLAWALSEIEDCYREQPKPIPYREYDRLRSVSGEEA